MKAEPQKEHEWLHQLIGEWTCEGSAAGAPGQPPVTWKATETVRSLGGIWVIGEGTGEMPGGGGVSQSIITLGYDPAKGRFVGNFIASMMTYLWVYDGELDAGGTVLTLNAEGPGMSKEVPWAAYRDVIEVKSPDHRIMTSYMLGADGKWTEVMAADYKRNSQ